MNHTELNENEPRGRVRLYASDTLMRLGLQSTAEDLMFLMVTPAEDPFGYVEDGVWELGDFPDDPVVVRVEQGQVVEVLA